MIRKMPAFLNISRTPRTSLLYTERRQYQVARIIGHHQQSDINVVKYEFPSRVWSGRVIGRVHHCGWSLCFSVRWLLRTTHNNTGGGRSSRAEGPKGITPQLAQPRHYIHLPKATISTWAVLSTVAAVCWRGQGDGR